MNTKQFIEQLKEIDPSGEMIIGYNGVAITHFYKEHILPASYIDEKINFHIQDDIEWININTVSYKDFLNESKNIIIDIKDAHTKWMINKEINQYIKDLKKQHEESIKELTFDIIKKMKQGYKILQSDKTSSMVFHKDNEKEISLNEKECKAVIESLFFNNINGEWKLNL